MAQEPVWIRDLRSFCGQMSCFVIEGNIHDSFLTASPAGPGGAPGIVLKDLVGVLDDVFKGQGADASPYNLMFMNPALGFHELRPGQPPAPGAPSLVKVMANALKDQRTDLLGRDQDIAEEGNGEAQRGGARAVNAQNDEAPRQRYARLARAALTQLTDRSTRSPSAVVMNYASRYLPDPERMDGEDNDFFLHLLYAVHNAKRVNNRLNTLILLVDKATDLPSWFLLNNPSLRQISIPNPDRAAREQFVMMAYRKAIESQGEAARKPLSRFVDLTNGLKLKEVEALCRMHGGKPLAELPQTVFTYKYGYQEDKWLQLRAKLTPDFEKGIKARVIGQDQAVDRVLDTIKRAVLGLSGLQHSSASNKPRGILFLAGPTGTGKTEIVKAVAEQLFEDQNAIIRFDMSEYNAEHADQKLFGAPPGYVGYSQGGQLTNAVRNQPFSVLLFDEIEKAHPTIMDKFLQILEDGRMTDGQGRTVYFSQTLIFFTSNAGMSREIINPETRQVVGREMLVKPGDPDLERKINEAVRAFFKPEVINRIGENIVAFHYLDEKASEGIILKQIRDINRNLQSGQGIAVQVDASVIKLLKDICAGDQVRVHGGRGIGNMVEAHYLNRLAKALMSMGDGVRAVRAAAVNGVIEFVRAS